MTQNASRYCQMSPAGMLLESSPVESHWFTTVRSINCQQSQMLSLRKNTGHPILMESWWAEQEVRTKEVIRKKKMWLKYLMPLAWDSLRDRPHSREMSIPGPHLGWALPAFSPLAQIYSLSPLWSTLFPRDNLSAVLMLLKYANDLAWQKSMKQWKQVTSEGSLAPNTPPQAHHSLKLCFTLEVHMILPSALWEIYIYKFLHKKQINFPNHK